MTDNDNIIIEQLFSEARKTEIEDNGFSHRVMRSLPDTIAPHHYHFALMDVFLRGHRSCVLVRFPFLGTGGNIH